MIKTLQCVRRLLPLLLFCASLSAFAQKSVSGKVTSGDDGSTLPGVNIIEKGTSNGTVSDVDGNYRINVGDNAVLVFSFVGFTAQEITVGANTTIDVTLAGDATTLSEIVVTGYGTQEKKELTTAVTSVKSEDFNRGTINEPLQLLQGKVAGLTVTRPGGDPNGGFNIRLRGISTFGANQEPLIVIDGVIGGSLSTVDPNDIAAIDVLKDGSAAAIYGSRGGSGVIIITTKKGKAGKVQVDYNASYAIESVANTIDVMNASEYLAIPGPATPDDLGSDTDWLDVVTRNGNATVHNISVSGGSNSTTYRASFNYRRTNGIAINSGFEQLNGRINITQKALNDRAKFSVFISNTSKDAEYGFKESLRYAVIANPTLPVYDNTLTSVTAGGAYGGYAQRDIFDFFNPLAIAEQNVNDGTDERLLTRLDGEYDFSDIIKGLTFNVSYALQKESDFRGYYYSKFSKFRGSNRNGLAGTRTDKRQNQLFEAHFTYDNEFGGTNLELLGGYSYQDFFNDGFGMEGGDFLTDALTYHNIGAGADFDNGLGNVFSYADANKLVAFFGRAILNFKGNFFLTASVRQEGSTRFGENNKWGTFPAVSGAVNLSNLVTIPMVNNLKIRASYGVTGNQPGFSYASIVRFSSSGPNGSFGSFLYNGEYVPIYAPVSNPNPDLKWETKNEIDVGLDFSLLDNKLTGTFDFYTRDTKDVLLFKDVPVPPNLFEQTLLNVAELKNSGIELALNYNVISSGKLNWTTGGNISTFKTEIVKFGAVDYQAGMGAPGQNAFELARIKEGEMLGELWGPIQESINTDGTPKFQDLTPPGAPNDNSINGYCNCDDDETVIGRGLPKFTLGWNNSLSFGNFDLNLFFRGAFGHDLLNSYRGFYENLEGTTVDNYNVVNTEFFNPAITKAAVNNTHVEKANFVKLDNATLGYNVNLNAGSKISRLRFYVAGQNLFVITKYTGIDPEVRMVDRIDGDGGGQPGNENPFAPGIERRSTYLTTRTITLGLNLSF